MAEVRSWRAVGRLLAVAVLGSLVTLGYVVTGPLAASILFAFSVTGLAITSVAVRRLPWLRPRTLAATALVGLLTHPFGDLFTGEPPVLFYPLDWTPVAARLTLHPDPTLHLLAVFGLELLTIWVAVAVFLGRSGHPLRSYASPRAALGIGYAAAAVALPAPTLDVSYHFVFSILAVGTIGPVGLGRGRRPVLGDGGTDSPAARRVPPGLRVADGPTALVTALAAISVAAIGYTAVYLVL